MTDIPDSFNPEHLKQLLNERFGGIPRIQYDPSHANELSFLMAILLANQDGLSTQTNAAYLLTANCLILSVINNLDTEIQIKIDKCRHNSTAITFSQSDLCEIRDLTCLTQRLISVESALATALEECLEREGSTGDGTVSQAFLDSLGLSPEQMQHILGEFTSE